MDEGRVDRLLRLAEEAAMGGDIDRVEALLGVADRAIYMRNLEVRELKRMVKVTQELPDE